jgi:hypothetical protein
MSPYQILDVNHSFHHSDTVSAGEEDYVITQTPSHLYHHMGRFPDNLTFPEAVEEVILSKRVEAKTGVITGMP